MPPSYRLHLASQSPRRYQLLEGAGFDVICVRSRAEPDLPNNGDGAAQAMRSALGKLPLTFDGSVVLSADTVVHQGQRCFGKPDDADHAALMLAALEGRSHQVSTAVALRHENGVASFCVSSDVHFRPLNETEIRRYIASGEPMDKAGGYGIQGLGAGLIESVSGSHTCVVGLPLSETLAALAKLGVLRP